MVDMDALFDDVRDTMRWAKLVAFDGCHKIYLAMDETEKAWFLENYQHTFSGTEDEMTAKVREWYDNSCPLRFVNAVKSVPENPNDGFITLIEQGASDQPEDEYEDEESYE